MNHALSSALPARPSLVAAVFLGVSAIAFGGFFINQAYATSPNLTITAPTAGSYIHGTYSIGWTASTTASTLNLLYSTNPLSFLNGVQSGITAAPSGTTDWTTDSGAISDGTYYLQLQANTGETVTSDAFNIDNTPPVTTMASSISPDPLTGWYNLSTGAPTITLTCDDPTVNGVSSGCSGITYAWYDASTGAVVTATSTDSGSSATVTAPEGDNLLVYYSSDSAIDKDGAHNTSDVGSQEFKVDTAAPTITSYTLNGGTDDVYFNPNAANASTTIHVLASEPVKFNELYVCPTSAATCDGSSDIKNFTDSSSFVSSTTKEWNGFEGGGSPIAPDGAYKLGVSLVDQAGNPNQLDLSSLTPAPTINIDTAAPTATFAAPAADALLESATPGGDTTAMTSAISFTASDGNALTYAYSIDGGASSTPAAANNDGVTPTTSAISGLTDGRHTILISVCDEAGNCSTSSPVSFVFDNDATLTVSGTSADNADFATVTDAVAASDAADLSGETIDVFPGTYAEDVTLDKPFTLEGHASGATISGQVELDADNDTVQNLAVTNPSGTSGILINGVSDARVSNTTVSSVGTAGATGNVWGIYYQSHTTGDASGISIENNTVSAIGSATNGSNGGIGIGDSLGAGNLTNVVIDGNTVSGIAATSGEGAYGIQVNHGASALGTTGVAITHNTVHDLSATSGWATAIGLEGPTPGADVEYNTVHDVGNAAGVAFNVEQDPDAASIILHHNSGDNATVTDFVANKVATTTVDATNNWWGTAVRSIIAGKMFNAPLPGAVVFDPYYVDAPMTTLSNAPVSDVYVNTAYTDGGSDDGHIFGYDAFSAVQDGADAAALSALGTVHVAAGAYPEDVSLTRALTLAGAEAGVAGAASRANGESAVQSFSISASGVTLDGFTLDGAGTQVTVSTTTTTTILSGDSITDSIFGGYGSAAVLSHNAGNVSIADNLFNAPAANAPALQITDGMTNSCGGTSVTGNHFAGASNSGGAAVQFACDQSASTGVTVSGNVATATGADTDFARFTGVASDLEISGNTLTGISGNGFRFTGGVTGSTTIADNAITGSGGSAISLDSTNGGASTGTFLITNNTLTGNADGLSVDSGGLGAGAVVTARGNDLGGNTSYGADNLSSAVTVDAAQNWWGDASGPYHPTKNPLGQGSTVSDYVAFSPFCMDEGCTTLGSIGPIASLKITANPDTGPVPLPLPLTVSALDAGGYPVVNDTSEQLQFSADHGATLGSLYANLGADGTAANTVANTLTGATNVGVSLVGASPAITASTVVTFTPGDVTPPSVLDTYPAAGSTDASPTALVPYLDFSEPLAAPTVTSANIQLRKVSDDSIVPGTVALVEGGTRVTITPASALDYGTAYYFTASASVTDLSGNGLSPVLDAASKGSYTFTTAPVPPDTTPPVISDIEATAIATSSAAIVWTTDEGATSQVQYGLTSSYGSLSAPDTATTTSHSVTLLGLSPATLYHFRVISTDDSHNTATSTDNVFTTPADDSSAALAVTGIDATQTFATPDDTFADGWQWVFHVTVPTSEDQFAMKFSDFVSGTSTIPAAGDIEYYTSAASAHSDSTTAVAVAGANAYPASITLDGADLDPATAGKQILVTVEVKVPAGTAGGSYSASYGVKSDASPF